MSETTNTAPQYPYQPPPAPPKKRHTWRNVILATLGVMTLIVVISAVASGGKTPSSDTGIPVVQVTDQDGGVCSSTSVSSSGYCPGDIAPAAEPAPSPTTQAPQYTVSQQQAIDAAQSYLSEGQGFSEQGLINQLSSQYGNGFSVADATFAVNTINPDWNAQAALAAKSYMTTEPGWSACSLEQQLDSPYGGYFSQAQAEYGVQSVGLGTC